jgi:hypothetical protein
MFFGTSLLTRRRRDAEAQSGEDTERKGFADLTNIMAMFARLFSKKSHQIKIHSYFQSSFATLRLRVKKASTGVFKSRKPIMAW